MATAAEITSLLAAQDVPADLVEELVEGLSGMLLLDEAADVLAGDLALCHPPLAPSEVRVEVRPTAGPAGPAGSAGSHSAGSAGSHSAGSAGSHSAGSAGACRVTVVAHDRPGLLAATAGALAGRGLSVTSAGAATWERRAVALQGVTVIDPQRRLSAEDQWLEVGEEVSAVVRGTRRPTVTYRPAGPVRVVASPVFDGHALVTVEAPDRVGLLWAIASWFEAGGYNVIAARLSDDGKGRASDTFLVDRAPDVDQLLARLAGSRRRGRGRG